MIVRISTIAFMFFDVFSVDPIVTAKKLIDHRRLHGQLVDFESPKVILVCYQRSTLEYLLQKYPHFQSTEMTHFYASKDLEIGILGGLGIGAPSLAVKMEELIVLGAKRFLAIGTAGALTDVHSIASFVHCTCALAEDGVAHLYLPKEENVAEVDSQMLLDWKQFVLEQSLPEFRPSMAWSFSAIYRETVEDVNRVSKLGCSVVEMEAATLYAIARNKGVRALTLFVISDSITGEEWTPQFKDPMLRSNLHKLADWALKFCTEQ